MSRNTIRFFLALLGAVIPGQCTATTLPGTTMQPNDNGAFTLITSRCPYRQPQTVFVLHGLKITHHVTQA